MEMYKKKERKIKIRKQQSFYEESIDSFNKRQVQKELVIFSIHKLETSFCKLSFILYWWYLAVSNTIMCMMIKGSNYFILLGFTAWKWLWLLLYHVWIVSKKLFSRSKKALLRAQTPSLHGRPKKIVANGEELDLTTHMVIWPYFISTVKTYSTYWLIARWDKSFFAWHTIFEIPRLEPQYILVLFNI